MGKAGYCFQKVGTKRNKNGSDVMRIFPSYHRLQSEPMSLQVSRERDTEIVDIIALTAQKNCKGCFAS